MACPHPERGNRKSPRVRFKDDGNLMSAPGLR
jgi:hypothetical protein